MPTRTLAYISLGAIVAGIVIFIASVIGRAYQLVLPAAGAALILAIVGVVFGHRALASALNEKSSVVLPVICLVLGYGVALFIVVWLVALILAIRNFTQRLRHGATLFSSPQDHRSEPIGEIRPTGNSV